MVIAGLEHGSCVLDEDCPYYDEAEAAILWAGYEAAMRAEEERRKSKFD